MGMNKTLQHYFDSFKLGKQFVQTFLTDLVSLSLIALIFTWFSSYIQQRSFELLQGRTTAELQQYLLSLGPQQLPFLNAVKWFLITSVIGLVIIAVCSFLFYSYAQARIWNSLQHKSVTRKSYWRWNLLNLSLFIPLLLFLAVLLIVKLILMLLSNIPQSLMPVFYLAHSRLMENIGILVNGAVLFFLVILFMVIIFLIYHHFAKSYRVWDSLGAGFSTFAKQWKKVMALCFFATLSAVILALIILPIKNVLLLYPLYLVVLTFVLGVFFLAWLRWYVFNSVLHGHQ